MHTRAVVNAGPLVALSLAGRLDLPTALFREIAIDGLGHAGAAALSDAARALNGLNEIYLYFQCIAHF